ncbi:MAG: efflux RND transporter periplasmic adaptor subunit [Pontibacterium sp.]
MTQVSSSRKHTFLKWFLPLLFLSLAIASFMFMKSTKPQAPSRAAQEKVWAVSVQEAQLSAYQPELTLYGKIESPRVTTLSSSINAYVADVPTDEGRYFKTGDLLLQLDDRDIRLLVSQREADLRNSEAQRAAEQIRHNADLKALVIEKNLLQLSQKSVSRYESLIKRNAGSQNQLDNARISYHQQALSLNSRQQAINDHPNRLKQMDANLQRAKALYDAALLDLERSQIKAPFEGRVARLQVSPGDRVHSGDTLLTLYGLNRLEVRTQIPSRILPQIRSALVGQSDLSAQAMIDSQPLRLKLDRLASEVNGGRAGVDAFFDIETTDLHPEPGRSISLSLKLPQQTNLIALPPQALYGIDRIYRISEQRLQAITVERAGEITLANGKTQILVRGADIKPGDKLVTTQLPNASTGLKVKEAGQ